MSTRREFVSTLGAGGAILFGGVQAQAGIFGRLRRRRCCEEPAPCCGDIQRPLTKAYEGAAPPIVTCTWMCPRKIFGKVNNIYYYQCVCCPGTSLVNSSSPRLLPLNTACAAASESTCIAPATSTTMSYAARRQAAPLPCPGRPFFPEDKLKLSGHIQFNQHIEQVEEGTVANVAFVKCQDKMAASGWRYFKLFEVKAKFAPLSPLRIGQEMKDLAPEEADLEKIAGNYGRVRRRGAAAGECYHVFLV